MVVLVVVVVVVGILIVNQGHGVSRVLVGVGKCLAIKWWTSKSRSGRVARALWRPAVAKRMT